MNEDYNRAPVERTVRREVQEQTKSLVEQVLDAQREVAMWSDEKRKNVQLEGCG